MADINKIKIGTVDPDSIMFDKFDMGKANAAITFGSIIPKDNSNAATQEVSQSVWQVNDGWEVEIISPKKIAIKKFKIDTWGLRQIVGNPHTDPNYNNLKIGVEGIQYVHNNVVCHTAGSDTPDGFTKAYGGNGGYNVYWYPGQFNSGSSMQGLVVQFGCGYNTSDNGRDDSFQIGKHPWDVGTKVGIVDGTITGTRADTSYRAITIGLFGGVQSAASWHDESGDAYKVYDISDHPIYINLDVEDTTLPVDPTSVECWDAYVGETPVWHRDKTFENCWIKHRLALPNNWAVSKSTLSSNTYVVYDNPLKFRVKQVTAKGITINTSLVSNNANYWSISFPSFIIKVSNLPEGVTAIFRRPVNNTTSADDTYSKVLVNGENTIEAYSKTVYRQDSGSSISYRAGEFVFTGADTEITNFLVEIVPVYSENTVLSVNTSIWSSIISSMIVPEVTDVEDYIGRTKFNMKPYNTAVWDRIKTWYENNTYNASNFSGGNIFKDSNLDEITIRIPNNQYQWGEDNFAGSSIKTITFVQEGEKSHFSAPQRLLRSAGSLKTINIEWADPDNPTYICGANTIADGMSTGGLETYPERFIHWNQNRSNVLSNTIPCTLFQYAFNWASSLVTIPSFPSSNEEDNTIVPANFTEHSFYYCSSLTTVGPILNMVLVQPANASNMFHNCNVLSSIKIKNLNHGSWSFDAETRDGVYIGTLKALDTDSVQYLFANLADLTTHDPDKHEDTIDKSFKNWSSNYFNSSATTPDWDYDLTNIRQFTCRKRYATQESAPFIVATTEALDAMVVKVQGLQDGDSVIFGESGSTEPILTWTKNGNQNVTKVSGTNMGFKLISSNTDDRSNVTITIYNGLDYTNPRVSSANLYCPEEWSDKVTSEMITAANAKGWTIYIGGVLTEPS